MPFDPSEFTAEPPQTPTRFDPSEFSAAPDVPPDVGGGLPARMSSQEWDAITRGLETPGQQTSRLKPLPETLREGFHEGVSEFRESAPGTLLKPFGWAWRQLPKVSSQQVQDAMDVLAAAGPGPHDLSAPSQPPGTAAKVVAGGLEASKSAVGGMLEPEMLATLGTGALPNLAGRLVSIGFTADMLSALPEQWKEVQAAVAKDDAEDITKSVSNLIYTGLFAGAAAKHGFGPERKSGRADADAIASKLVKDWQANERAVLQLEREQARRIVNPAATSPTEPQIAGSRLAPLPPTLSRLRDTIKETQDAKGEVPQTGGLPAESGKPLVTEAKVEAEVGTPPGRSAGEEVPPVTDKTKAPDVTPAGALARSSEAKPMPRLVLFGSPFRVVVQEPITVGDETSPAYVSIQSKDNAQSGAPDYWRKLGYDVPDFSTLPQGTYTLEEATRLLAAQKPVPTTLPPVAPATPTASPDIESIAKKLAAGGVPTATERDVIDALTPEARLAYMKRVLELRAAPEPSTEAAAPLPEVVGPKPKVTKDKDFISNGIWHVQIGDQKFRIFHDAESKTWYDADVRDAEKNPSLTTGIVSQLNKADAIANLQKRIAVLDSANAARKLDVEKGTTFGPAYLPLEAPPTFKADAEAWLQALVAGGSREGGDRATTRNTIVVRDNETGKLIELSVWDNNGVKVSLPQAKGKATSQDALKFLRQFSKQEGVRERYTPVARLRYADAARGLARETTPDELARKAEEWKRNAGPTEVAKVAAQGGKEGVGAEPTVVDVVGQPGVEPSAESEFFNLMAGMLRDPKTGQMRKNLTRRDFADIASGLFENAENRAAVQAHFRTEFSDIIADPRFKDLSVRKQTDILLRALADRLQQYYVRANGAGSAGEQGRAATGGGLPEGARTEATRPGEAPATPTEPAVAAPSGEAAKPAGLLERADAALEQAQRRIRKSTFTGVLGIEPILMDGAISVARAALRATGSVARAITSAVDWLKARGISFDEAEAERFLRTSINRTTQVHGIEDKVDRAVFGADDRAVARVEAMDLFRQAGLPVSEGAGGTFWIEPAFPAGPEARRLEDILMRELQRTEPDAVLRLQTFLDAVRINAREQISRIQQGEPAAWTLEQATRLYNLAQSEISFTGQKLAALPRIPDAEAILAQAQQIDTTLRVQLGRLLLGDFGTGGNGPGGTVEGSGSQLVNRVVIRLLESFRDYFTDAEINDIRAGNTELNTVLTRLESALMREQGSIVYRLAQGRLKPKARQRLSQLLRNARVQEAVEEIIQQARRNGVEERPKPPGLTAGDRLLHMVEPDTAQRIDEAIRTAVSDAELAAGRKAALQEPGLSADDRALLESGMLEPTDAQIEAGLNLPEYAAWRVIRDNLVGYSPVTDRLVQRVLREDFKGTRLSGPDGPRPVDTRIDLNALAKAPEAEVQRVMDGYIANLEAAMNLRLATPAVRQRVAQQVSTAVRAQLEARRREFLNNFFNPKERAPVTASEQLKRLLNAGVSRDPRFQSDLVRRLIKRVDDTYLSGEDLRSLATSTRQEKRNWLDRKADEILGGERLRQPDVDDATANYADAVTRTHLAERLMAAEESITRSFLEGKDKTFDPKVVAPDARERSLEAAKAKLENLIRAGAIDTATVESAARKSAVQRLVPSMPDLVRTALSTPAASRAATAENFANTLSEQLGIDPAQADKAGEVLEAAFNAKFAAAIKRAREQVVNKLAPEEKAAVETKKRGKSLADLIEEAVNTGVLDDLVLLRTIAERRKLNPPPMASIEQIRALVAEEQRLRTLTPEEVASAGGDANKLRKLQLELEAATHDERQFISKRLEALMRQWAKPLGLFHWFRSRQVAENNAQAVNELAASNILARGLGIARQGFDLLSMNTLFVPWHRAMAYGINRVRTGPDAPSLVRDVSDALKEAGNIRLQSMRATLATLIPALRGKGLAERIHDLETGVGVSERLILRAEALEKTGTLHGQTRAMLIRLYALQRLGIRAFAAFDAVQATSAQWQEMRHQVVNELRKRGTPKATIDAAVKDIFRDLALEYTEAVDDARAMFASRGKEVTDAELRKYTWDLVRQRAYAKMELYELPVDDFKSKAKDYNQAMAWNLKAGGLGAGIATPLHIIQQAFAHYGLPTGGITAFGNAMGTALNRGLTYAGGGFFPGLFKNDPFYKTEVDRTHRKLEAITGLAFGIPLVAGVITGAFTVRLAWPKDEKEREEWRAKGIRPYTVEFPVSNDSVIRVPLRVGPMAPFAPWLAGAAAWRAKVDDLSQKQAKLDEEAAKQGLTAARLPGLGVADGLGIAGAAAWQMISGGRTASGVLGAYSDYGGFDAKKFSATYVSSLIPGSPAWGEAMRAAGVQINPKLASFWDLLVPMPSSGARRVNVLGDATDDQNALERIIDVMTLGGGIRRDRPSNTAYAALFGSGYMPPSIDASKAYNINGELRRFTPDELADYTEARGRYFKAALAAVGPDATPEQAAAAFKQANAQALQEAGVTGGARSGGGGGRVSVGGRASAGAPRLRSSRPASRLSGYGGGSSPLSPSYSSRRGRGIGRRRSLGTRRLGLGKLRRTGKLRGFRRSRLAVR